MAHEGLPAKRTTLTVVLVALVVAAIGVVMMVVSEVEDLVHVHPLLAKVLTNLGALLVATVAISVLWELTTRRALADELFAITGVSDAVRRGGLISITNKFYEDIPWSKLYAQSSEVDLLLAYGRTWSNSNRGNLVEFANRPNTRLRVLLPDPECEPVISELARRFEKNPDELKGFINESMNELSSLFPASKRERLQIYLHKTTPVFTAYRFNSRMVIALYKHRRKRQDVPTFFVEEGGTVFKFVVAELDELMNAGSGLSRAYLATEVGS